MSNILFLSGVAFFAFGVVLTFKNIFEVLIEHRFLNKELEETKSVLRDLETEFQKSQDELKSSKIKAKIEKERIIDTQQENLKLRKLPLEKSYNRLMTKGEESDHLKKAFEDLKFQLENTKKASATSLNQPKSSPPSIETPQEIKDPLLQFGIFDLGFKDIIAPQSENKKR